MLNGSAHCWIKQLVGALYLLLTDTQLLAGQLHVVKTRGEIKQRIVATFAHGLHDRTHALDQVIDLHLSTAQQASTFQAAIVLDIPDGLHVNSNRPLGKYAIPTSVKVSAPKGLKITPVSYPPGRVRTFRFGEGAPEERLSVYEGRAIARFNVGVPADFEQGVAHVRVSVRFQSCNDEVCFPPATRELDLAIAIVGRDTPVNHINGQYFGGGRRRRG